MKYIKKNEPPQSLEAYKILDGACFNEMPSDVKEDLRAHLIDEQGGICCYCGKRILPDCHSVIEHLLPKGLKQYQHLQLAYSNLLCSCDGGESDRTGKTKVQKRVFPPYCDSKKNNRVIKITPLDENCESYFLYDDEGHIYGRTAEAVETIEILGLDCSTLVNLRKAAIDAYSKMFLPSDDDWEMEISYLKKRSTDGNFRPFCFAVIYYIQHYKMSFAASA